MYLIEMFSCRFLLIVCWIDIDWFLGILLFLVRQLGILDGLIFSFLNIPRVFSMNIISLYLRFHMSLWNCILSILKRSNMVILYLFSDNLNNSLNFFMSFF